MEIKNKEIAIVGVGFRIPQGKESINNGSVSHLWNNLKNGFSGIVETSERWSDNINLLGEINNKFGGLLPLKEWSDFDPVHFAINPSEVPLIWLIQSIYRKSIGLPSTCTNWGTIKSAGFVSRNELVSKMLDDQGFIPIPTNIILGSLDLQLQNSNKYSNLIVKKDNDNNGGGENINISESIQIKILNKISELLSIEQSKINTDIRLSDYGADSLTSVQLKNFIDKDIKSNAITLQQLQNNTIGVNIQIILEQIKKLDSNETKGKSKNIKKDSAPSLEYWRNEMKLDKSIQAIKMNPIDFRNDSKV
ncbi:hypothetical protein ACTFIZ_006584 [Dictyostelium cf. discoideum]